MSGKLRGVRGAINALKKFPGAITNVAKTELYKEAEGIMAMSKEAYVPVDVGNLRNSGSVELPKVTVNTVSIRFGFGNFATTYAFIVHEDLNAFHPTGQAKYLEVPYQMAKPGIKTRFLKSLRDESRRLSR